MKKLFIIVCLEMLVFSCSPILKCNSNDNSIMEQTNRNDNLLLNETEGAYLNRIFETTRKDFDFINKKIGFIMISGENGKNRYFDMQEKHSINENYPCDNGTLYIFDTTQKAESGGYDAAITYWNKFVIPIEGVVKRLKNRR
ncbi:MAG: hypothetical protein LBK47_08115 [Prevotellaceae bacterium]|nr:hypothetical protein [Prevotellaceae bacterium]